MKCLLNLLNFAFKISNYKFHYKNNLEMTDRPINHNLILPDST